MFTKTVSVVTLIAFTFFTLSCGTTRYAHIDTAPDWEGKKIKILRVQKTDGNTSEFYRKMQSRIQGSMVSGYVMTDKKIEIDKSSIRNRKRLPDDLVFRIITRDGKRYFFRSFEKVDDKLIMSDVIEDVSIPLSDVQEIEFLRKSGSGTLTVLGLGVALGGGVSLMLANREPKKVRETRWTGGWGWDFSISKEYYWVEKNRKGHLLLCIIGGGLFGLFIGGGKDKYVLKQIKETDLGDTYKNIQVKQIIEETEEEILIPWSSKQVWLPKSMIQIEQKVGFIIIRMSEQLYEEKLK